MVLATAFSSLDPALVEEEGADDVLRDCSPSNRLRQTRSAPCPRGVSRAYRAATCHDSGWLGANHWPVGPRGARAPAPTPAHRAGQAMWRNFRTVCKLLCSQPASSLLSTYCPGPQILHARHPPTHTTHSKQKQVDQDDVCWICLDPAGPFGQLERPCACPRSVHAMCLARWQLHSAGRE